LQNIVTHRVSQAAEYFRMNIFSSTEKCLIWQKSNILMKAYSMTRGKRNYQQVFLHHLKTAVTAVALQPFNKEFTVFTGSIYYRL